MCRLFGFHSIIPSRVHSSLVTSDRSFMNLSHDHPDGWGVAYYLEKAPHIVKSEAAAVHDQLFRRLGGMMSSHTVLAHLRKATEGRVSTINTHPFQYGSWVFAHNGHIQNFASHRNQLEKLISPNLRRFILGDTDSELLFYIILTEISQHQSLGEQSVPIDLVANAVSQAIAKLIDIIGPYSLTPGNTGSTYLSFILTNGEVMLAHQGGQSIHYSSYKSRCSERESCNFYAKSCENPPGKGPVSHLLFSSEPIPGENVWLSLKPGEILGVDRRMNLFWGNTLNRKNLEQFALEAN